MNAAAGQAVTQAIVTLAAAAGRTRWRGVVCAAAGEARKCRAGSGAVVADRDHLSDLSALVSGQRRRRHRRPERHHRPRSIISSGSASMPSGSRRSIRRRWPISAMTSRITATIDPLFGTLARFRSRWSREAHAPRPEADPRLRAEPHLRPASLVPRKPRVAQQSEARLVPLARPGAGWRAAQQLAQQFRRQRLGAAMRRRASTTIIPSSRSSPTSTGAIPTVRRAMYDVLRFWLERGVDGFRVDVLWLLIKDDQLRDNPVNPAYAPGRAPRKIACCRSTRPTGRRCTRSSPRCAACSTAMATAC